ncbi:hypothetical protein WOA01_12665 [Methylocystis sp. IM2]|uniref:hypothetical protein n=1 Tax=Methylocystis sp. IM2 TaxID=3136563 RepID=UPI0030F9F8D5
MNSRFGSRILAWAALGVSVAFAAPATADTADEIRALKARLNKLEAQEAESKRAAKAVAAQAAAAAAAHPAPVVIAGAPPAPKHWVREDQHPRLYADALQRHPLGP